MPLTNRYLKYSPEITLEIFTLVWESFIRARYDLKAGLNTIFNNWKRWNYIILNENSLCTTNNPSLIDKLSQTTVQEILGYDPFVKDDFVLPKKWCIKIQANGIPCEVAQWRKSSWSNSGYISSSGMWNCDNAIGYPEITLDQFKKYVLKESIEQPKEEVVPEYVELLPGFDTPRTGEIFDTKRPTPAYALWTKSWTWEYLLTDKTHKQYFKPSTKEAYLAQNKPIEKWSVGSYVVAIKNGIARSKPEDSFKIGFIDEIDSVFNDSTIGIKFSSNCCDKSDFKWFATKAKAEEFAKTLVESVKGEPKQPLKQAVHCKTQEEWDFVQDKIGYKFATKFSKYFDTISLDDKCYGTKKSWYDSEGWDVLSFQEWCDLNGYKMEKEVKSNQEFKVGDYIFVMIKGKNFGDILKVTDSFIEKKSNYSGVWINHKPGSFGGGGFRLNGNGYIYGKDVRHATPEEINNHLISIGQIPAGEPLNNGIEPNKDGAFKYTTLPGSSWNGLTPTNHLKAMIPTTGDCYNNDFATSYIPIKSKMILSIDDEELPMVNIIKTNSIKQLLNND